MALGIGGKRILRYTQKMVCLLSLKLRRGPKRVAPRIIPTPY